MLAACKLLLPGLDLFFPRESIGRQYSVDHGGNLGVSGVDEGIAFKTLDAQGSVVLVLLLLSGDGKLRNLLGRLVPSDSLACPLDIQHEGVGSECAVEGGVLSVAGATAVKTLEADIEAVGVVLSGMELGPGRMRD